MKRKIRNLDGTPPKDIYRSIIADYDFKLGICELIDNAIDIWNRRGKDFKLNIQLLFDLQQQKIQVIDNAGGISENEILLFLSPGRTGNNGKEETIGIFGVGSKRAVVALAQDIKIRTRQGTGPTLFIEFDDAWLNEEDWNFEMFEVDKIEKNTTIIELLGLRQGLSTDAIKNLREHISYTYAEFISNPLINITIDDAVITPIFFDRDWAYPPEYCPKQIALSLVIEGRSISIKMEAGLIGENASAGSEYGVYFYCNNRLIAKGIRNYEVGYTKGKAGNDHPALALARVIVKLNGDAQFMPWNSSKSSINYKHKIFEAIRDELINLVVYYSSLSRRWQGHWPETVFQFKDGELEQLEVKSLSEIKNAYNTPLPQVRIKYSETIKQKNKNLGKKKPWVIGLYEGIIAADYIQKQSLEQKNRFALIMLDSTLEIAFKEFLVNELSSAIGTQKLLNILQVRTSVISEVKQRVPQITQNAWARVNYYYTMRCNLIHLKATSSVTDQEVSEYRQLIETILHILFKLKF
jgi:hypothetical protein